MFDLTATEADRRGFRAAAVDRLRETLDELTALPVDPTATRANLEEIAVLERVRSWGPAQQSRVLAALEVAEPRDYDPDSPNRPSPRATTPHEIALILRVSTAAARGRLEVARGLVDHFPATLAASSDGTLPWWQARRALEETTELSPAARAAVDRELAEHAGKGRSPARFGTRLRGAILDADPAAAEQQHVHGLADRAVWVDPHPDGTVTVAATLAAESGAVFLDMVDRLADTPLSIPPAGWPIEGRTADQRRADGLSGLAEAVVAGLDAAGSLDPKAAAQQAVAAVLEQATGPAATEAGAGTAGVGTPRASRRFRRGGQVLVTVSAETLLGISDAPGDLDGHGPISAGHARRLAGCAESWRRLLTDPVSGAVLDIGRTRYTPTTAIAEHVLTRSGRQCTRPGCPRPAAHLDHAQPWSEDGSTAVNNLTGLCLGDHRARHTGWNVAIDRGGATTITTTHGFTATTAPHDHRPEDRRRHDPPAPPEPPEATGAPDTPPPPASAGATGIPGMPPVPPRAATAGPGTAPSNEARSPAPTPATRPATPLDRLQALFPTAQHTDFPIPEPTGIGDPQTGHGWLTDMQHYIEVTHDRARARRADPPPPPDPPLPGYEGPDDPPPF